MKYSVNHHDKFIWWQGPFFFGFFQVVMIVFLEFVNLLNICAQVDDVEIVMNFIALTVIAEFDNFIYKAASRHNRFASLL